MLFIANICSFVQTFAGLPHLDQISLKQFGSAQIVETI